MTSAQNARSLATANKKMDLSRQTEHEIAAPLSPDGPHHAPGRRRADPTTVRIEASVGVQTSRFFEDGQSRHVGLDNFGLLIEASSYGHCSRSWSLDHPTSCGLQGSWFAFLGDHAHQATLYQKLSGEVRVVGAIEVDARMLGQLDGAIHALQGFTQKRRVMAAWPERRAPPEGCPPRLPSLSA
jgi:hypothetical protein